MNMCRTVLFPVTISVAFIGLALGQTASPSDTTSPNAASPPHHTQAAAPANQTGKIEAKQTMKACIVREQADHTGMTMAEARKSCKEQLAVPPQK